MKNDCIFCKLANNVYPTNSIFEDELFNVILDAGPATKGHALIIPKEHYASLYEMPEDLLQKAIVLAKRMTVHMTEKLKCDGFNIVQNNGEAAGQTVFHFHIHLIPRYKEDHQNINWNQTSPSPDELTELRDLLA